MTLHRYFAWRYLLMFGAVFGIFLGLTILFDFADEVRRLSDDATFGEVIQLTLLSAPVGLYRIIPLITIIAAVALFLQLARTSELVVARASGRSGIRALLAPGLVALLLGGVTVAILNPLVATVSVEYETRRNAIKEGITSTLSISDQGLWLRQGGPQGQTVIRALSSNLDGTTLQNVTFLSFGQDGNPVRRIEAATAKLMPGGWDLTNAKAWPLSRVPNPEQSARFHETLRIPSDLTRDGIRNSFGDPASIPIWDLPAFIAQLETAGFSARRHLVWLHMEIALPVFMLAMMLLGAGFTMRHARVSRTGLAVLYALMLGFGLYFLRNFAQILGENGQMPILLAAWAPPLAALGLAFGKLLREEDG